MKPEHLAAIRADIVEAAGDPEAMTDVLRDVWDDVYDGPGSDRRAWYAVGLVVSDVIESLTKSPA